MDAVGPDEIQLPEGVERYEFRGCNGFTASPDKGLYIRYSDLPAIIAAEREKWEAELSLLGIERCQGDGIGFHNVRAEEAEALVHSPYCTEGCHLGAAETCGHPRQTWQEVAERNAKAAGERRGEGRADFLRAEQAEAERDQAKAGAKELQEKLGGQRLIRELEGRLAEADAALDAAEIAEGAETPRLEAVRREAKAQALAELREGLLGAASLQAAGLQLQRIHARMSSNAPLPTLQVNAEQIIEAALSAHDSLEQNDG